MEYSYKDFVEQFYLKDFYKFYVAQKLGITEIKNIADYEFMSLETYMKKYGPSPEQYDYDLHYRKAAIRWAKLYANGSLPLCSLQEPEGQEEISEDVSKQCGADSLSKQQVADDMMSLVTDVVSKNDIAGFSPDLEVENDFDK